MSRPSHYLRFEAVVEVAVNTEVAEIIDPLHEIE